MARTRKPSAAKPPSKLAAKLAAMVKAQRTSKRRRALQSRQLPPFTQNGSRTPSSGLFGFYKPESSRIAANSNGRSVRLAMTSGRQRMMSEPSLTTFPRRSGLLRLTVQSKSMSRKSPIRTTSSGYPAGQRYVRLRRSYAARSLRLPSMSA